MSAKPYYSRNLKSYKVGIVGVGVAGGAIKDYFEKRTSLRLFLYDKFKSLGSPVEVNKADIVFICVPTPTKKDKGFDSSIVEEAVSRLDSGKVVVIKSTVLPGTTERLQEEYPQQTFLANPEFLTELTADQDMNYPDRQLIGYTKKRESYGVAGVLMNLLPMAPFERIAPATEIELAKYFGNAWFSHKVTFSNIIYDYCQKLGIDYETVKECAGADKRIGRTHLDIFHRGYRGYGGKCLPKDFRALINLGRELGVDISQFQTVEDYNNTLRRSQDLVEEE